MGDTNNQQQQPSSPPHNADYLAQLLKDRKQVAAFPNVFQHVERILDEEINKVRLSLFHLNGSTNQIPPLPEAKGPVVTLSEKVFVPVKEHPDFNFVGRILGPRGMTAKQLEQDTGCKIMVRGKGSMRDKKKEEMNKGKANWEHLNEELHVLITVEDTQERAVVKLKRAVECINQLLVPAPDGEDDLKKSQLMELAIMNGTFRDTSGTTQTPQKLTQQQQTARLIAPPMTLQSPTLRSPTAVGHPLIVQPRFHVPTSQALMAGGLPPPLVSPQDHGVILSPYDYQAYLTPTLLEYPPLDQHVQVGAVAKQRRHIANVREHPYQRGAVSMS